MLEKTFSQVRGSIIFSGILSIILGILFIANPIIAGFSLCHFVGCILIISGAAKMIFSFVNGENIAMSFVGGLVIFLFGIVCINRPDVISDIITLLAGIYIVADGATTLCEGIACVRAKVKGGWPIIIASVILMMCGVSIMFAPFGFVMMFTGIVLIGDGIFALVFVSAMRKAIEEAKQKSTQK